MYIQLQNIVSSFREEQSVSEISLTHLFCDVLRRLSAASMGLFAGAMLTEGLVLVPYWRSLPSEEFFRWYAANDQRLLGFFGPLTWAAALPALAAAFASLWEGHPGRWASLAAAALSLVIVSTFFLYFKQANAGFTAATIRPEDLPAELARWSAWHWRRTWLSIAALAAAMLSLWRIS